MPYQPKTYFDNGNTLQWGKDISETNMELLRQGEIFTLLDSNGLPKFKILMDSYNVCRAVLIPQQSTPVKLTALEMILKIDAERAVRPQRRR